MNLIHLAKKGLPGSELNRAARVRKKEAASTSADLYVVNYS